MFVMFVWIVHSTKEDEKHTTSNNEQVKSIFVGVCYNNIIEEFDWKKKT